MHLAKRFAVTVLGVALLALGLAMMVLPGPGILIIVGGLAVLATEYVWARRMLRRARKQAEQVQEAAVASPARTGLTVLFALGLTGLGGAMLAAPDVELPVLSSLWSPITGGILLLTGLILLTTTYLTYRAARGEDTTHTRSTFSTAGSTRIAG